MPLTGHDWTDPSSCLKCICGHPRLCPLSNHLLLQLLKVVDLKRGSWVHLHETFLGDSSRHPVRVASYNAQEETYLKIIHENKKVHLNARFSARLRRFVSGRLLHLLVGNRSTNIQTQHQLASTRLSEPGRASVRVNALLPESPRNKTRQDLLRGTFPWSLATSFLVTFVAYGLQPTRGGLHRASASLLLQRPCYRHLDLGKAF